MQLILGIGSNLGSREDNIHQALGLLNSHFLFIAKSRLYLSDPVDYLDQPEFINIVVEYDIDPNTLPLDLLKIKDVTVSEIAYQVGFNSPSYFIKCFKETYGTTPNEYLF